MKHIFIKGFLLVMMLGTTLGCTAQSLELPGQIVFFRSNNIGSKGEIFLMNSDGSYQRQIGNSGSRPDHYPKWSPDGTKITFESYRQGGWRIWIMDKSGKNAKRLIKNAMGIRTYEFDPTFNAKGDKVIYFTHFTEKPDLASVDIPTGVIKRITFTPDIAEYGPDVSIKNDIVFGSSQNNSSDISKIDGETGLRTKLTADRFIDLAPVWSSNAEKIVFYSNREGGFELFIMNADGTDLKRLISNGTLKKHGIKRGTYLKMDEGWNASLQYRASFSFDDKWITFSADTNESREIFVVSMENGQIKQLTKNTIHDGFPMFSPN